MISKRRKVVVILLGVVVAIALIAYFTREREPSFKGRPLSHWIENYNGEALDNASSTEAKEAIHAMGTNALPRLLELMRFEPPASGARIVIGRVLLKLPVLSRSSQILGWCRYKPESERAWFATTAFSAIGTNAQWAIPELVRQMNETNSLPIASRSVYALGQIGVPAVPALLAQLANTNAPKRVEVVRLFISNPALATNNPAVVRQILACLTEPDPQIQQFSANALQQIARFCKPQPDVVVPALVEYLPSGSPGVQGALAEALGAYGVEARAAVPHLQHMLNDSNDWVRLPATMALLQIAPEALTNAPPQ